MHDKYFRSVFFCKKKSETECMFYNGWPSSLAITTDAVRHKVFMLTIPRSNAFFQAILKELTSVLSYDLSVGF